MTSYFGTDKNKIENYKHCENASLKLSIPPHELLNLVSLSTEESSWLVMWLAIEKDDKKKFISQIDQDSFEILLKGRVRGHYNSYAPWLHGQVIPTESGCQVTVWFKLSRRVRIFDMIYNPISIILSLIIFFIFIANLISYGVNFDTFSAIYMMFILLGILFFNRYLKKITQKDKEMLCDFLMELINPYKIDNDSNN